MIEVLKDFNMHNINYKSPYYQYAGKTLKWLVSDTQKLYVENLRTRKYLLVKNGWLPFKNIDYSFNSHGFRCDEFSNEDSIIFLGCSFTAGVGLSLEDTFAYLIAKKLNLKLINLGIGSSGVNTSYRLGSYWIPRLKPKIVVYMEPDYARLDLVVGDTPTFLLPNLVPNELKKFYEDYWLADDTNFYLNGEKSKLALKHICLTNNIKFFSGPIFHYLMYKDHARDLSHAGIISHKHCAEYILNSL